MENKVTIRELIETDWSLVWDIIKPVFREGKTYAFDPQITEEKAFKLWVELPQKTYVAVADDGRVLGSFYIKPNFMGNANHVCNCGYIVSEKARGLGVASSLCEFSQSVAVELGYAAMQFNFVVSTNQGAIRLWQRFGFEIAGTMKNSFRHPELGLVDAHVMYKLLT